MGEKKKVLLIHFNRIPPKTGGEYAYFKIYQALKSEYEVTNISINNLLLARFPNRGWRRALTRYIIEPFFMIYPMFVRQKYDLIFTSWSDNMPFFGDAVYAQPIAGDISKPGIASRFTLPRRSRLSETLSDSFGLGFSYPLRRIFRSFTINYMRFISNSECTKDYIAKTYNKESVVIYPPVNVVPYLSGSRVKENLVVSIGAIVPEKCFTLIGAVGPKIPEAKFVLIGGADDAGLPIINWIKRQFRNAGLDKNFEYLGRVPESVKIDYMKRAKVIFHPAPYEPFGISIIEGMAAGAIPVAHNSGGPTEFLERNYLFDDEQEIAEKIRYGLNADDLQRGILMHQARKYNEARFKKQMLIYVNHVLSSKA